MGNPLYTSSRHWFNAKTNKLVVLPVNSTNHTSNVFQEPDQYDISLGDLKQAGGRMKDYDGSTLFFMMKRHWVRIHIDRKQPDFNSNFEGVRFSDIRDAIKTLDFTPIRLIIVLRKGPGDKEGVPYVLNSRDGDIDEFLDKGRPPRLSLVD